MSWGAALCALAACGRIGFDGIEQIDELAPIDPPPRYVNGTRLRAIVYPGVSQSVLSHWYDSELDVDCYPRVARDGRTRCLPAFSETIAYKDAGCTELVAAVGGPPALGCDVPTGAAYDFAGTAIELGATYTGPLYLGSPGSCTPNPFSPVIGFEVGPALTDDRFVEFEEVVLRGSQRLAYVVLRAADGAQQHAEMLHDTLREERCVLRTAAPGTARCMPNVDAFVLHRDSACTSSEVYQPLGEGPIFVGETGLCAGELRMFERGPQWTEPVYRGSPGNCTLASPTGPVYEPGAEIAIDLFPELFVGTEPFDARLQHLVWRTPDGITVPQTYNPWIDVARGQHCEPTVEETSSLLVCAPAWGANGLPYWTAAGCSSMEESGHAPCRPDSNAIFFATLMSPRFTCDGLRMAVLVSETPVAMPIWEDIGGTCTGSTTDVFTTTRFISGTELPPLVRVRE